MQDEELGREPCKGRIVVIGVQKEKREVIAAFVPE
jgi:hypothetical protein